MGIKKIKKNFEGLMNGKKRGGMGERNVVQCVILPLLLNIYAITSV